MISQDTLDQLATRYQTSLNPNVLREYFQHLFLSALYALPGAENILFKGGTALRIVYKSPRFSEDLDFSLFNVPEHEKMKLVEDLFISVLNEITKSGIGVELGDKPDRTKDGYQGDATFQMYEHNPIHVGIDVSFRNGRKMIGEIDSVACDFVPTYNIYHLPEIELMEEKIFSALLQRKKARDFYDLYFILRKGTITPDQKKRLFEHKDEIMASANKIDFKDELLVFLPKGQHDIIRDFEKRLIAELQRQFAEL